jgi:hypothetical protein
MSDSRTSHLEVRQGENAATPHLAPHLVRGAGCGERSRTCDLGKVRNSSSLSSSLFPSPNNPLFSQRHSIAHRQSDQLSSSLLACRTSIIDLTHVLPVVDGYHPRWEWHGKIDRWRNLDRFGCLCWFRPNFLRSRGVGGGILGLAIFDVPPPYATPLRKVEAGHPGRRHGNGRAMTRRRPYSAFLVMAGTSPPGGGGLTGGLLARP